MTEPKLVYYARKNPLLCKPLIYIHFLSEKAGADITLTLSAKVNEVSLSSMVRMCDV
jgi:hypothetical protein